MSKIYVIHENGVWLNNLRCAFEALNLPYEEWNLVNGKIDINSAPPEGIFYNRMSASSHTRGHRYSAELTSVVLNWLEGHSRRVVNGSRALQLEVNKAAQLAALNAGGVSTPRTIAVTGYDQILDAADQFSDGSFIFKPNRGGKGQGVQLIQSRPDLETHLQSESYEAPIDGISLLQEYIESPEREIIRIEFIGGRFLYAVRVDTRDGFELCPADACQIETEGNAPKEKFKILSPDEQPSIELLRKCEGVLARNGIEVAAIEFVYDAHGNPYAYDLNTNTNYNDEAENKADTFAMQKLARFLGQELQYLENRTYKTLEKGLRLAG